MAYLPNSSVFVTGTFTAVDAVVAAPDGLGTLITGNPTSGSVFSLAIPDGLSDWLLLITGWTTGTVYSEGSSDSTNGVNGNWQAIKGRKTGTAPGVETVTYAYTASDYYRGNISGFKYIRVRYLGTFTAGCAIRIDSSSAVGPVFLNSGIPTGGSTIGNVKPAVVQQAATNLTALNVAQTFVMQGEAAITIQLSGTWTATAIFEGSMDNFATTPTTLNAQRAGDNTITQTVVNSTNNDIYRIGVAGFLYVRVRCSAYTSGTIVSTSATSFASSTFVLSAPAPSKEMPDASSTFAPTNATTTVYATNLVVKASAGVYFSMTGYNSKASAQFIQIHNATALPADTAVPVITFTVPGASNFSLDFGGKYGRYFSTGIIICNSSTGPTKTIGAADCWFDVQYS